ncbi:TPA: hypothetical protein ACH3X3_002231 [Trebouxia sp. C0006]
MDPRLVLAEESNKRLATTLQHYRNWAGQLLARYQMANPDASRPPRRIYVGGLPAGTTEAALRQFINEVMIRTGAVASAGFPISNCKVYSDKNYAFLEFRSVEEASNCMAFDGMVFNNTYLRIRRPNNYDYNTAVTLGFTEPNPVIDLNQLEIVRTVVQDSPNKLFIGGLPCEWSEDQVKEKLTPFGMLKAFNLVMDKTTGNSKGYAFCEYQYPEVTDAVIDTLNLQTVGSKTLTVKRAVAGQAAPQVTHALPQHVQHMPAAVTDAFTMQQHRRLQQATQAFMGPVATTLAGLPQ